MEHFFSKHIARLNLASSLSIVLILIAFFILIFSLFHHREADFHESLLRQQILESKKHYIKDVVYRTLWDIEQGIALCQGSDAPSQGEFCSQEAVRERIKQKIRALELQDDGYVWINEVRNYEGGADYAVRLVHPNLVETEGMLLSTDMTDIKGNTPYLTELEGVKEKGEIFFTYWFKRKDSEVIGEKLTFAKLYAPYNWIVATGVYLDDIEAVVVQARQKSQRNFYNNLLKIFLVGLLACAFIVSIVILFHWQIRKAINAYEAEKLTREDEIREINQDLEQRISRRTRQIHASEARLAQSEEKYRLAMEASSEGLWDWDIQTGEVFYNETWAAILSEQGLAGVYDTWVHKIHPQDKSRVLESLQDHLGGKTGHWAMEHRLKNSAGEWIWVLGRGRVVDRSDSGQPLRMVGTMVDITARKQVEAALKEKEAKYRLLADNVTDVIFMLDLELNYTYVSPSVKALRGYTPEEVMGQSAQKTLTPESFAHASKVLAQVIARKTERRASLSAFEVLELEMVRKDGSTLWAEVKFSFILDEDKTPKGILGVTRDIDKRIKAEKAQNKLQAQLVQAQKMDAVGRLAGGVAHDFNNMLTVILGNTAILLEELDPADPGVESLKEIEKAAERSGALTRQLLAFARKQTTAPVRLDLNEVISGMLKMLGRLIGENIELSWHPAYSLWPVKIDPSQVDQILANLCVNARDAIADVGKIRIETRNMNLDDAYCWDHPGFVPGDFAMIIVSDDGCGMEPIIRENLFEPFFTTKATGKGTGLGLATVYGIVKQNKGFINVYSETGHGSVFKIYLPRDGETRDENPAERKEVPLESGSETILLVEDDPGILKITRQMLERLGYGVLAADCPEAALDIAQNSAPGQIQLLMTDVIMPRMNGRDLAVEVMKLIPGIKCLFMSGYTDDVIASQGILDQGLYFINKPFLTRDLAKILRQALDGKKV